MMRCPVMVFGIQPDRVQFERMRMFSANSPIVSETHTINSFGKS